MEIHEFIGTWENESGNILEIRCNESDLLMVDFISGKTGEPVIREYYGDKDSVKMPAELDFCESSLVVELWEKGKGFQLLLLYDWIDFKNQSGYYLAPGITEYFNSNLTKQYGDLFMPLEYYKRMKNSP